MARLSFCDVFAYRLCFIHSSSLTISNRVARNRNSPLVDGSAHERVNAASLARRNGRSQYKPHWSMIAIRQ